MSREKLEDKCVYKNIAENERERDLAKGKGKKWTMGFEEMGCYECNAENVNCDSYISPAELYKVGYLKGYKINNE